MMADQQKMKKTPEQQKYDQIQQKHELKRPVLKNCLKAFFGWWCDLRNWTSDKLFLYL